MKFRRKGKLNEKVNGKKEVEAVSNSLDAEEEEIKQLNERIENESPASGTQQKRYDIILNLIDCSY
jgi:hypothetical protein